MRALVYTAPQTLELREAPDPEPAAGEALVAIAHAGICGSDMHAFLGHDERRPAPLILGHEAAGTVLSGPRRGERVTINPLVPCGACERCASHRENLCPRRQILSMPPREGAFAERLAIPEANLVTVPQGVPTETAALAEPLACGWHAVRLAKGALDMPLERARCLVLGGGAIGLGSALTLRHAGVAQVTLSEPSPARRERLSREDGVRAIHPQDAPDGVDLVVDAVGIAATRAAASAAVRPGGVIVHVGLGSGEGGLDVRRVTLQEITVIGSYTYTRADFSQTAAAIFAGDFGALDWIEVRPLDEGARAFADIRSGAVGAPKIVLQP